MNQEWEEIEGFPIYSISIYGEVWNARTSRTLVHSLNQQGIPSVGLTLKGDERFYRRSVPLLVAKAFLPDPGHPSIDGYSSPIQLDGDRENCRLDNLMWRPRWFAVKYHQERVCDPFPDWSRSFEAIETREVFTHPKECAMKYGLLETDICHAIFNANRPFGTNYTFRFI